MQRRAKVGISEMQERGASLEQQALGERAPPRTRRLAADLQRRQRDATPKKAVLERDGAGEYEMPM